MFESMKSLINVGHFILSTNLAFCMLQLTIDYGINTKFFNVKIDATTRIKDLEKFVRTVLFTACVNFFLWLSSLVLDLFL